MSTTALVAFAALPWIVLPVVLAWWMHDNTLLDEFPAEPPVAAPLVTVVVPARNEARNIEPCMRSILATSWPSLELIIVDDGSEDGTIDIARRVAVGDRRVRVIANPELPAGWFGKQWACHNGARTARGRILCFTDADTRHGRELLARSVNAMRARGADLFSVVGGQTLGSFWERLLQPHIFALIGMRFGSTKRFNRTKDPFGKIANGQYMLITREAYDAVGGHESVRTHVAEDLRLAQECCRMGLSVQGVVGLDHLTTRMYEGLGELARGWGKNIYAAGRDTVNLGPAGQALLRVTMPFPALLEIGPAAVALAAIPGWVSPAAGAWGAICYVATTLFWVAVHRAMKQQVWYALLHPLASTAIFGIFARAAWKGDRVEWKGRSYVSR